jgi:hypothetical protein
VTRPICVVEPFAGGSVNEAAQVAALEKLCDVAVDLNVIYLREHPETPQLYSTGILYRLETSRSEDVYTIPFILERGRADCDGLACWRAAEIRLLRGPSRWHSRVRLQRASQDPRERDYHAVVTTRTGFEDPSTVMLLRNG